MRPIELIILAAGLAMDAFAVSIGKGLACGRASAKKALWLALWFGGFQALMPAIGYALGTRFQSQIARVDHWVAFGLLAAIGLNMLREGLSQKEEGANADLGLRTMLLLATATSIDALAVGITLAILRANLIQSVAVIGSVTFALSAAGFFIGTAFGSRHRRAAQIIGGLVLVAIGAKILIEHLLLGR